MLGLGETLARRRGLLRAMNKSLRGLEDYYRRIVFSVADQATGPITIAEGAPGQGDAEGLAM